MRTPGATIRLADLSPEERRIARTIIAELWREVASDVVASLGNVSAPGDMLTWDIAIDVLLDDERPAKLARFELRYLNRARPLGHDHVSLARVVMFFERGEHAEHVALAREAFAGWGPTPTSSPPSTPKPAPSAPEGWGRR